MNNDLGRYFKQCIFNRHLDTFFTVFFNGVLSSSFLDLFSDEVFNTFVFCVPSLRRYGPPDSYSVFGRQLLNCALDGILILCFFAEQLGVSLLERDF